MEWHCKHVEVLTGGDSTEAVFALCSMPRGEAEVTTWHSCMPGRLEQADMLLGITGMQHWQSPATTGSHSFTIRNWMGERRAGSACIEVLVRLGMACGRYWLVSGCGCHGVLLCAAW